MQARVNTELSFSDELNEQNLLRFYNPSGFTPVNPKDYNYQNGFQKELGTETELGKKSTSLYDKLKKKSTQSLYKTDAPELNHSGGSSRISKNNNEDK